MDRKQIEAVEASRPASNDLATPELEFVARATETDPQLRRFSQDVAQADQAIAAALRDVPVPLGLRDRIVAALAVESARDGDKTPFCAELPRRTCTRTLSRRHWIGIGLASGVVVACVVFSLVFRGPKQVPVIGRQYVESWVQRGLDEVHRRTDNWVPMERRTANWYPISPRIKAAPTDWRRLTSSADRSTQVFRWNRSEAVLLFVAKHDGKIDLSAEPPNSPYVMIEDFQCGFWREGSFIYGLAVRGSKADFERVLKSSARDITGNVRENQFQPVFAIGKLMSRIR